MAEGFDEFAKRISQLPVGIKEVYCRKYVASNPNDAQGWWLLINSLRNGRNYAEASYTIDQFVKLHGAKEAGKRFALQAYFQVGAPRKAYQISLTLADPAENNTGDSIVNFLHSLYDAAPHNDTARKRGIGATDWLLDFNEKALPIPTEGIDVALFLKFKWHLSIQRRIAEELRHRGLRCLFLSSIWELVAAKPKVILVSDALDGSYVTIRHFLPRSLIVYTRHGLGDKNYAYSAAGQADVTCMSASGAAREFAEKSLIDPKRLWITGYPQMDDLFHRLKTIAPTTARRTVLVAPTYNEHLHAGEILGTKLVELVRGDNENTHVMIKPHPHYMRTHSDLVAAWEGQARSMPNVSIYLSEETNLMDLFAEADVMVSDVSSAGLAWLATGRPLVCIADPQIAVASPFYAPDGLECRMQYAAVPVQDVNALSATIEELLNAPPPINESYRALQDHLFGDLTDGRASARVAALIKNWINENY